MKNKFAKLILEATKPNSTLEIFVVDEIMVEKSNLGRLFMLVEINSKERGLKEKIKSIFEMVKNDYYASPIPNIETSFETTCQNLNLNFKDVFNKPEAWYKKVNILTGVIKDDKLVFSHLGKFSGYLVRKNKISQILNTQLDKEAENMFSQLTSGEIKDSDVVVLSNYTLFDFFSLEKIKNVLAKLNPEQSAEQFKNLIEENAKNANALSLIIKTEKNLLEVDELEDIDEVDTKKYIQELYGSQESMQQLENLKEKTNSTLADCIWPNLDKMKKIFSRVKNKQDKKLKMPKKDKLASDAGAAGSRLSNNLEKMKKVSVIFSGKMRWVLVSLVGVFILSLFYIGYTQNIKQKNDDNQAIVASVQDKKDEAEAALIYQDKEKANELLVEAKLDLESLNLFNDEWQIKYDEQNKIIQKVLNKINNIFEVDVQEVASLESGQIEKMVFGLGAGGVHAIDLSGKVYLQSGRELNELEKLNELKVLDVAFFEDGGMLVLSESNKFHIFKNDKLEELNITLLEDAIVDEMEVYGERIYFLDRLHGVYKVSKATSANPQMTVWYADDKDLINNGQQIFVDGNIWVNALNKIFKLYRSEKTDFELSGLNTVVAKDFKIYTAESLDNLYVLDKENGRVVVSDKNGVAQKQFLNEQLKNAEGFVVIDDKVIFNVGNKVWEMRLMSE